jgi:hypothetical protein
LYAIYAAVLWVVVALVAARHGKNLLRHYRMEQEQATQVNNSYAD